MLIGIDMLAIQSPEGGDREAGRFGRQLVAALLARDPVNRYVLYAHEGLSTARIAPSRSAVRSSLPPVPSVGPSRLRSTTQRLLDRNPDGLDWLLLLDPFEENYGGVPPESPLNGVKLASIVHDLAPALADDRRLASLRRHDAVLAVSASTAAECRRRLGAGSGRVATIGLACDEASAGRGPIEPLSLVSAAELGRLGITGSFLLASVVGGDARSNLGPILDAYRLLPIEHRRRHQLVIAGRVDDPAAVRKSLVDRGCGDGLILAGELPEASLRSLYGRCSAFLAPTIEEGSGQSLVEAMRCGAPVIAGLAGDQAEIVGDGGLLVDPTSPAEIASGLAALLSDADLDREVRSRALARSARFSWGPVVESLVAALERNGAAKPKARLRFDRAHVARPRIAVFPDLSRDGLGRVDLASQVPADWEGVYNVDLYLDPGNGTLADGLPGEFGGFDARLFARNDEILGYHAVLYRVGELGDFDATLGRLKRRPGVVLLHDDDFLDRISPEPAGPTPPLGARAMPRDLRPELAVARLREVFQTGSRVVVRSPRHLDQVRAALPEFADQVAEVPPAGPPPAASASGRARARARLDLLPGTLLIGQFAGPGETRLTPRAFQALARSVPEAVLLCFDGDDDPRSWREARRLGIGGRFLQAGEVAPGGAGEVAAMLDLAIHPGDQDPENGPVSILDLLRAGVPTIAIDSDLPAGVVRHLAGPTDAVGLARSTHDLAADPEARAALGRSARDYLAGRPDPARASAALIDEIERCAEELPRTPGRRLRRPADSSLGLAPTPHFPRPAPATDEAATRRGER